MHRFLLTLAALLAAFLASAAHAQSFSDTFDDSSPSTYWQAVEAVDAVSIAEVGGKLEFTTTADPAQTSKKFAGYLARNWHMRTTSNFFMRVTVRNDTSGVSLSSGSMQSLAFGLFKVGETPDSNGFPGNSKFMEVGARRVSSNGGALTLYRWIDFMRYSSSGESQLSVPRYAFTDDPNVFYSASSGMYAFNFPTTQTVYMRYTTNDDTLSISLLGYNGPYIAIWSNFTSGQKYPVGVALGGYGKLQGALASGKATYDNLVVDSATIDAAAPNFVASDGTFGDKVQLTWSAAPGATGYKVFRTPVAGGSKVELASGLSSTALSYNDTTAERLVEYTYAVQTLTAAAGDTEYQATDVGWRNIDIPTGVTASDATYSDKIRINWNAVDGAIGYGVYRAIGTGTPALVGQTETDVLEYDDTTAAIGTVYSYTVKAISALGSTGASTADNGSRAPYPPTGVAAGDGTFSQKTRVTWTAVPGATAYRIYRRADGGTSALLATASGGATSFYDDTTAAPLVTYFYSVTTMSGTTESAASDEDLGWRNIPAPTLTAGAGTSASGVSLSWTAVTGATSYRVLRAIGSGTQEPIETGIAGTTFLDDSADPLVVYTYTAQAEHALGDSPSSTGVTGWRNLPPPEKVAASDGDFSNRVLVSWSAVSGATGYSVWRKISGSTTAAAQIGAVSGGSTLSYSDTTAAVGTSYLYSVKATHPLGATALSATDSGWRSTPAPTTTAATDGTFTDKIRVTWSSVAGATGYKLFRSTEGAGTIQLTTLSGAGTVAYDDTSVLAARNYSYFVRATTAAGDGPAGPSDGGWRNIPTPTGVAASDGTFDDKVRVTWAPTAGSAGYRVFRKLGSAAAVEVGTTGESITTFDDTSALAAKSYLYSVKAISALGDSLMSATDAGIRSVAAPLNVAAGDGALTTAVRVTWSLSPGATGYKVYRRTAGGTATMIKSLGSTATQHDDTTAVALTEYLYSVVATATGVTSAPSSEDQGWRNIAAPTANATLGTSAASVTVNWSTVSGATGYRVLRAESGGTPVTLADLGTVTNYVDTSADPLVLYQYRVQTLHALGASNPGNAPNGWRNIDGPGPIAATDGEHTTKVTISWPATTDATGYTVWRRITGLGISPTQIANITSPAQLAFDDTTAAIGTSYTYYVRSKHALGQSVPGPTDIGWRNATAPAAVAATDGSYTDKIRVTWSASTGATGFRVYRRQGSDDPVQVGSTASAGARTFDDTNASPAQNYEYFITAVVNTLGESAQSAGNTGWRAVAAPSLVAASDGTFDDRVRVTWAASVGATGYKVFRRIGTGATVEIASIADPAATSFDDVTVGPITQATYSVQAQSALGASATSLTNTGWCNLSAPTGVAATDGAFTTKVVVTWQAVTSATGYRVFRSINGAAATQVGVTNTSTLLYNDTTVPVGQIATYTVTANHPLGQTAQSASDTGFRGAGFAGGGEGDGGVSGGDDLARGSGNPTIGGGMGSGGAGESSDETDAGESTDDDGSAGGGMPLEPSCFEAILRIEAQVAELEANGSEQALALAADLAGLLDSADESVDGGATRACAILGGDIDGDGTISPADLVAFMAAWAAEDLVSADVNRDGTIDIADLAIVERRIAESATS